MPAFSLFAILGVAALRLRLRNRCGLGLNQNPPFLDAHLLIDVDLKINRDLKGLQDVAVQMFRMKAEGYKVSCKARITPFKTFSVSATFGSIIDESSTLRVPD